MVLFTSKQERGHVWRTPLPCLLLLLPPVLFPGAQSETQQLHKVVGQMFSVKCHYPPRGRPYQRKSWCKEVSAFSCVTLITSSSPRTLTQFSRFSIWDEPEAGFFIVSMTDLREEDSGHYWCRIYHTASNSVSKSLRVYLAVSPASTSTKAPWVFHNLITPQTQSCVSPTGRARETLEAASTIMVSSVVSSP